jgi:hypothetical protein
MNVFIALLAGASSRIGFLSGTGRSAPIKSGFARTAEKRLITRVKTFFQSLKAGGIGNCIRSTKPRRPGRANNMADILITVNENDISKLVVEKIASSMAHQYSADATDAKWGVRKGVETAVKDYVYSHKDEIIEKCIDRASSELVKKGLPKLLERLEATNE